MIINQNSDCNTCLNYYKLILQQFMNNRVINPPFDLYKLAIQLSEVLDNPIAVQMFNTCIT